MVVKEKERNLYIEKFRKKSIELGIKISGYQKGRYKKTFRFIFSNESDVVIPSGLRYTKLKKMDIRKVGY